MYLLWSLLIFCTAGEVATLLGDLGRDIVVKERIGLGLMFRFLQSKVRDGVLNTSLSWRWCGAGEEGVGVLDMVTSGGGGWGAGEGEREFEFDPLSSFDSNFCAGLILRFDCGDVLGEVPFFSSSSPFSFSPSDTSSCEEDATFEFLQLCNQLPALVLFSPEPVLPLCSSPPLLSPPSFTLACSFKPLSPPPPPFLVPFTGAGAVAEARRSSEARGGTHPLLSSTVLVFPV